MELVTIQSKDGIRTFIGSKGEPLKVREGLTLERGKYTATYIHSAAYYLDCTLAERVYLIENFHRLAVEIDLQEGTITRERARQELERIRRGEHIAHIEID